ncbi:hypothetical protein VCRA2119O147_1760002 [Vibrio crassostreae]|uniref:Uncharacterized protein n=1 Tax=Vibrio crassostreae TaxID=246167 RepID=A0A822MTR1_9VIBR|nr:hypothetical protein VCRA2118O144_100177 [Vibrio crassostreae]CAK1844943.1 hypothetical protein VCRA2110O135_10147 [Vibrio crassostreae]CAK1852558.1 hypothetical protein VCRA2110O173_10290 [Vibrio crassostreae]CAK1852817.1 hypothetical protein VCRA2110O175_10237 [Vibrio crassostreae]CAK1855817.1 hypothetical protein VCRA2113O221_10232 [Vibrio crassostreae]
MILQSLNEPEIKENFFSIQFSIFAIVLYDRVHAARSPRLQNNTYK